MFSQDAGHNAIKKSAKIQFFDSSIGYIPFRNSAIAERSFFPPINKAGKQKIRRKKSATIYSWYGRGTKFGHWLPSSHVVA
jgi:hypothetical protein